MSIHMSDVVTQVIAAGIAGLLGVVATQGFRLFGRMSRVETKLDDLMQFIQKADRDFHSSHARFDDGEIHHRRSGRV